jgi:DNA (cytosine-5)-methyltransferase 1
MADTESERRIGREGIQTRSLDDGAHAGWIEGDDGFIGSDKVGISRSERPGPTNGFWRAADWLRCRDGKWRPVEPGTFPLAHGTPARVVRLRAHGNAINTKAAQAFIECVM